jgi:hypothetical protein
MQEGVLVQRKKKKMSKGGVCERNATNLGSSLDGGDEERGRNAVVGGEVG